MKKLSVLFCFTFALALFISCETSKEGPSEVVEQYHQAIFDEDVETVMALSAREEEREVVEEIVEFRAEGMRRAGGVPEILEEDIDGDNAIVRCKFGPAEQDVYLLKVDGQWKVD